MKLTTHDCKGYSLIELIIVIGVATLVSTVGLFVYRDYSRKQTVVQEKEHIRTILSRISQRALSGEKPPACSGVLTGFSFVCANGGNTYSVQAKCSPAVTVDPPAMLPAEVTFGTCSPIFFNVLGSGTSLGADLTISLTGYGGTYTDSFVVKRSGIIQ